MQTVFRLKRPLEDSPSDALIFNCSKRQKLDNSATDSDCLSTVLQFSGTQSSPNEDLGEYIERHKNKNLKEVFKHEVDVRQKLRLEVRNHSKNNKYKIINLLRSNFSNGDTVTLVDIEPKEADLSEEEQKFLYDLYISNTKFEEAIEDCEIDIYSTSLGFLSGEDCVDESDEDSEDSNAENYYKNEYPDEDDLSSDDDIINCMNKMGLEDLSSDDEYHYDSDSKEDYVDYESGDSNTDEN